MRTVIVSILLKDCRILGHAELGELIAHALHAASWGVAHRHAALLGGRCFLRSAIHLAHLETAAGSLIIVEDSARRLFGQRLPLLPPFVNGDDQKEPAHHAKHFENERNCVVLQLRSDAFVCGVEFVCHIIPRS